jgi:unsaturated rhamnogalacturonyl hydrolase
MMKKTIFCSLMVSLVLGNSHAFAQTKTITLDYFFNHEFKKNNSGQMERFHYTWEDTAQSGYSKLGTVFTKNGFALKSLEAAPTKENLKGISVYLMVDPDTEKETANPNFIEAEHIKAIAEFVKKGGILVIMANDTLNVEFKHLNQLTETFGIHLNGDSKSKVYNDKYEMAAFMIPANDAIFPTAKKVYLKEVSSLHLSKTAKPILVHQTEKYTVGAAAKVGKGMVIVIGDPWFYNEYLNGRLGNNNGWDNDKAADDFTKWLYQQAKK